MPDAHAATWRTVYELLPGQWVSIPHHDEATATLAALRLSAREGLEVAVLPPDGDGVSRNGA